MYGFSKAMVEFALTHPDMFSSHVWLHVDILRVMRQEVDRSDLFQFDNQADAWIEAFFIYRERYMNEASRVLKGSLTNIFWGDLLWEFKMDDGTIKTPFNMTWEEAVKFGNFKKNWSKSCFADIAYSMGQKMARLFKRHLNAWGKLNYTAAKAWNTGYGFNILRNKDPIKLSLIHI